VVPPTNQAFSDEKSETGIGTLVTHRRENFDPARVSRASAHGMRLSAIEYGKRA
jgi:hypothetical protein